MNILRRAYWVVGEVFLSVAFIGLLFTSILVGIGRLSMDEDKQAEQAMVGKPAGWSATVLD
jgi:hypothetical protein